VQLLRSNAMKLLLLRLVLSPLMLLLPLRKQVYGQL
jgi:hypothetical protein